MTDSTFTPGQLVGVNPPYEAGPSWTGLVGRTLESGEVQIIAQLRDDLTVTPLSDWYVSPTTLSRPLAPYNRIAR